VTRGGRISRRNALIIGAGALGGAAIGRAPFAARADDGVESHGMSGFGDLKYPAEFPHFDYVEPNAPKGGVFSVSVTSRG